MAIFFHLKKKHTHTHTCLRVLLRFFRLPVLDDSISAQQVRDWLWIWKIPAPEKYKFFFWLACHNSPPTNKLRHRRGLCESPICTRCGDGEQTVLHCLRECRKAKSIWNLMGSLNDMCMDEQDQVVWLKKLASKDNAHFWCATVWWI